MCIYVSIYILSMYMKEKKYGHYFTIKMFKIFI